MPTSPIQPRVPGAPHAPRQCSRNGCTGVAVATLTYSYADSQAVIGPVADDHMPGAYDLCRTHAEALTVPRGWEVVRLPLGAAVAADPSAVDTGNAADLDALADAVREVGLRHDEIGPERVQALDTPPGVALLDEQRRRRSDRT